MILCSIRHNGQYLSNWNRTQNLSKPIWLSDVECTGRETDIMQCRHTPWGRHNCDHSHDVWMSCFFDPSTRYACELVSSLLLLSNCIQLSLPEATVNGGGVNFSRNLVGSLHSPSLSPLPLSLSILSPLLPLPSFFVSSLSFPNSFPSFLSQFPSFLIPFSPLIQLRGLGERYKERCKLPQQSPGEPRPLTHFMFFKLGNDGRCQRH